MKSQRASVSVQPISPTQLTHAPEGAGIAMEALKDIIMTVSVRLGEAQMPLRQVLELAPGSVVELDRLVGEPVSVLVNGHPFATGEVVAIDDTFGVRIIEILAPAAEEGRAAPASAAGEGPGEGVAS